jgi:putative membrane protein
MFIIRWFLTALILLLVSYVVPGVTFSGTWSLLITAIVLGLVNALIRPILLILTLPINLLTLGLFTFIINALMFWFVSSIVKGFEIKDFASAFWGALVYWILVMFIDFLGSKNSIKKAKITK